MTRLRGREHPAHDALGIVKGICKVGLLGSIVEGCRQGRYAHDGGLSSRSYRPRVVYTDTIIATMVDPRDDEHWPIRLQKDRA